MKRFQIIFILFSVLLIVIITSCYTTSKTGERCPPCYGTGKCYSCHGIGNSREDGRCRVCRGSGKCVACNGSGEYRRIILPGQRF
ncbi:MAG: hypothetical protein FWD28_04395 [Treponema sp.]|nr:hypothetical protein [Treponema sp.]